jgi:hypothetical protein
MEAVSYLLKVKGESYSQVYNLRGASVDELNTCQLEAQ